MKPPPRLRLEPRPSRIAGATIAVVCAAMVTLLLSLPLDPWSLTGTLLATAGALARGLWRCMGRGVPALLQVGHDRRLSATTRDGRSREGAILDDSYVGARLTTIVWRPDGAPWYAPARTILILPDTLAADEFRRLRVLLRYGRPRSDDSTSGLDAG